VVCSGFIEFIGFVGFIGFIGFVEFMGFWVRELVGMLGLLW